MRFLNFPANAFALLSFLVMLAVGCKQKRNVIKSPPHYNFSQVQTSKLDMKLKEISGLVWDREREEFMAQYDEKGMLFLLDKETKEIKGEYKFGDKGDYEDIALYMGTPYILRSDGMLTKIIIDSAGIRGVESGQISLTGTNDFETLYADTSRKALVMICKNCASDDKRTVSAFAYYPESGEFDTDPIYKIDAEAVKKLAPDKTSKLQPSAAAIHPILKKLYIVSSASNLLVITDLNGKVESVFELGKKMFPQPEGLTFKNSGDMYISNEAATNPKASIHRFVYDSL